MKLHLKSFKHCFPLVLFFIFLVLPIQAKNLSVIEINGKTYQCRNCHGKEINGVADDWLIPRHSDLKADLAFNSSVPKSEGPAVQSNLVKVSEQTQECLDCHESDSPGIVSDWLSSRHAQTSPAIASKKPELAKRVSFEELSSNLSNVSVGCYECHTLNSDKHNDNFIHNGVNINVVVSPDDCATCHPVEREQYGNSKKAHALEILEKNPLYTTLVNSTIGVHSNQKDGFHINKPSEITKGKTCFACHGTKVEAKGLKKITTLYDEMEVPNLTNWPNQGVGRTRAPILRRASGA